MTTPNVELEIYRRAFQAITAADLDGALRGTLEAMVTVAGADRGFVVVWEADDDAPRILAKTVVRKGALADEGPSTAILRRVLDERKPVRIENALEHPDFRGRPSVLSISVLSVLAVPIAAGDEALAAVYLDSTRLAAIFSKEAEEAALRLAATVAPAIRTAKRLVQAEAREKQLAARLSEVAGEAPILGRSPAFSAALERALKAAVTDAPVLLTGESGTGKELFARAIHRASPRAKGPFVAINCGAIPEGTLEAELFGYVRGAFTGAVADRAGRLEAADGGTVFLDEIGDMPAALQVKLLRVLQSGEIQKLGCVRERRVSVRVVAATHRHLPALVKEGKFREDLYYRLKVVGIEIPPLRDRGDDAASLAEAFAQRFGRDQGKKVSGLSAAAREAVLRHRFPGNVRELENAIRHAVVFASGPRIALDDLPAEMVPSTVGGDGSSVASAAPRDADELKRAKEEAGARVERAFVRSILERAGGNVSRAARLAGMNRTVLHELLARHGVTAADFKPAGAPEEESP